MVSNWLTFRPLMAFVRFNPSVPSVNDIDLNKASVFTLILLEVEELVNFETILCFKPNTSEMSVIGFREFKFMVLFTSTCVCPLNLLVIVR